MHSSFERTLDVPATHKGPLWGLVLRAAGGRTGATSAQPGTPLLPPHAGRLLILEPRGQGPTPAWGGPEGQALRDPRTSAHPCAGAGDPPGEGDRRRPAGALTRTASARCERADRVEFVKWCRVSRVSAWEGKMNLHPYFTSKTKIKWSAEFTDGSCKVSERRREPPSQPGVGSAGGWRKH